jgi:hypothetical protein
MNFLEQSNFDWMELLNFYERPFRAKLNPSKIWRDLDEYKNDSVGLSNYFKKWRTKVEFRPLQNKRATKYVYVGGEYSPDDRQCSIHIYSLDFNKHPFEQKNWDKFKYRVIQTLMHEMIHFMQYDRRNDEYSNYILPHKKVGHSLKDAERKYLSEFDEIQAYAHCVYLDFKVYRPNIPLETLLARVKTKRDSSTLHYILKTFDYDFKNNFAIPKLMQHIVKWDRKYKLNIKNVY